MAKSKSVADKIKDVVTLKTAKDNFFKNDGSLHQWIAHGSTEAANMVLHGHPAPVYAGNISPPDQLGSPTDQIGGGAPDSPSPESPAPLSATASVPISSEISFLSQTMEDIQQRQEINEPEMEFDQ